MARIVLATILFLAALTVFTTPILAETPPGFESLKMLAGNWTGKASDGTPITSTYQVVSGGSAVMETLHTHEGELLGDEAGHRFAERVRDASEIARPAGARRTSSRPLRVV